MGDVVSLSEHRNSKEELEFVADFQAIEDAIWNVVMEWEGRMPESTLAIAPVAIGVAIYAGSVRNNGIELGLSKSVLLDKIGQLYDSAYANAEIVLDEED